MVKSNNVVATVVPLGLAAVCCSYVLLKEQQQRRAKKKSLYKDSDDVSPEAEEMSTSDTSSSSASTETSQCEEPRSESETETTFQDRLAPSVVEMMRSPPPLSPLRTEVSAAVTEESKSLHRRPARVNAFPALLLIALVAMVAMVFGAERLSVASSSHRGGTFVPSLAAVDAPQILKRTYEAKFIAGVPMVVLRD